MKSSIKSKGVVGSLLGLVLLVCLSFPSTGSAIKGSDCCDYYPNSSWEKVKKLKSEGWSPKKLKKAEQFANKLNMLGAMVIYKGRILVSWGEVGQKIGTHSVRKSLMSMMYGSAVQNGLIDLSETIEELGMDDIEPSLTDVEKTATIKMLLEARSGIYHPAAFETKGMAASRPKRYSHRPGTFFYYNNWDFNALGFIYEEKTGDGIFESFKKTIGDPIGMQDFNPESDGRYVYDKKMSKYPAYPFKLSTRDMARIGLLMASKGKWKENQIISEAWVKESTKVHSKGSASSGGYGYMWRVTSDGNSPLGGNAVSLPSDLYTARGYKGHIIAVSPKEDLVFVYNNDDSRGRAVTSYRDIGKLLEKILEAKN